MSTRHLSDEQFGQFLAGDAADGAASTHLQLCAECRKELESLGRAVGDLNELSLAWAEQRAVRVQAPSCWAIGWHALPGWSAAFAAFLFCGVAIGVHQQSSSRSQPPAQLSQNAPGPAVTPTEDELAQDNRLLRSIDDELSRQVRPQVSAAELAASSRSFRHSQIPEVAN